MGNRRAKAIRRALNYHPRDKDAFDQSKVYIDHETESGAIINECVYGPYKEYKELKKLDKNPNYVPSLIMLPTEEETNNIAESIRLEQKEQEDGKLNTEN